MLLNTYKTAILSAVLCLTSLQLYSVPAKPGIMTFSNEGKSLNVYLHGDENFHYYTTEDGYLLKYDEGKFHYAYISTDNVIMPITIDGKEILASDASYRSEEVKQKLQAINHPQQVAALDKIAQTRGRERHPSRIATRAMTPAQVGLFPGCHFPAQGEQRALVVLVEYQDVSFTLDNPLDYFSRMLNEPGFSDYEATGSARDYFIENSSGQFLPVFDVVGPVKLDNPRKFYGGNSQLTGDDVNAQAMVVEACKKLDPEVDFSQYDRDGDGMIDNVFIFYAGRGEASGGPAESIWPHSWNITKAYSEPIMLDGVQLDYYACTNEMTRTRPDGIGTFVHEFSHVMGLPDLYSTSGGTNAFTPGAWSVMDFGPYNNNGCTPPMYSAFERYALGWIKPALVDKDQIATLPPISDNIAGIIPTNFPNEFFLIENRQQQSWDKYLPGHGMLVWHVDYIASVWDRNTVNNNGAHQYVDLIEADGLLTNDSREGDAFPGAAGVTELTDDTEPSIRTWAGKETGFPLTNIEEKEQEISFIIGQGATPIETPAAQEPRQVTAISAIISWKRTDAPKYRVDFYSKDSEGLPYNQKRYYVEEVDSLIVENLEPENFYSYTVRACDGLELSAPSEEIEFYTGHLTIDNLSVETLPVKEEDIFEDGFSLSWEPLEDATSYFLNLYTKEPGDPYEEICDFSTMPELPEGWSTDATLTYGMRVWAGEATPSLRMNGNKYIESPIFPGNISSISFWHRGSSTSEADRILVETFSNTTWSEFESYPVVTEKGGQIINIPNLPENTKAVRISFVREGNGNLALDDISVRWGARPVDTPLEGYYGKEVGNVTEYTVRSLLPGRYFFTVTATDGEFISKPSEERTVLVGESSINRVDETTTAWYLNGSHLFIQGERDEIFTLTDISGRLIFTGRGNAIVTLPSTSLLILKMGSLKPVKIMTR